MTVISKLTKKEFINANFIFFYSKLVIRLYTVFISIAFVISIIAVTTNAKISIVQIIAPFLMLCVLPLLIYARASRAFASSNMNKSIEYKFDQTAFNLRSESASFQMKWGKIYKVTQTKKWLLIWQNKNIATPIPKRNINEAQIGELKQILTSNKVKNNL